MHRFLRSAVAFAAFVLSCGVAASELALDRCVEIAQPAKSSGAVPKAIWNARDAGNVTVMEFTGDYSRGQFQPRQEVAQRFYAEHPDAYDFLIVFTTFEFDSGGALALNNRIKNDVAGIGQPLFDHGESYGSAGRLQSYIDMAALSRYTFNAREPGYETVLNTLAHELMHQWGANVAYRDAGGLNSAALLGQEGMHWSYFLDTDASVMYGSDWQQRPDGRYEAVAVRRRFSALDLYLAGFAAANEVPPMTLIRNGDGDATALPRLGATTGGQGETVSIEQIVAANGARVPTAADAPKSFRAAMIVLTNPGVAVSPQQLQSLETLRVRFQQRFAQMTDGRAHIRIFTESNNDDRPALPQILVGSGATTDLPGNAAAAAWLEARQAADGHWEDRPATALRDTAAALRALEEIAPQSMAIPRARLWIEAQVAANLDARAWQLVGTHADSHALALTSAQRGDGGWALAESFASNPFDTATVASALLHDDPEAQLAPVLAYLAARQNADGSFGATTGGRGRVLPTLRAARLLQSSALPQHRDSAQRAAGWFGARLVGGGIGQAAEPSLSETIETYALVGRVPFGVTVAAATRTFVRTGQARDGDWGGSVYLTATAALASARDQRPNFAVAATPVATPAQPHDGERVRLAAVVVNQGNAPTPPAVARWYDGDPAQGGTPIGADIALPAIVAGSQLRSEHEWDTTGRAGEHVLHFVVDPDAAVAETRENDNAATLALTVAGAPTQPDLQLVAADFAFDPPSLATLPATVRLTGIVRNTGLTAVTAASLRLRTASPPLATLAQTTLDVPARGSAPLDITFTVADTTALALVLAADPDDAIAEAREDNNIANLTLGYGQSLDLDVDAADIALDGAAVAGRDVAFRVLVRNRGTLPSPQAALHAEVEQNGVTTAVFDGSVQIPAGGTAERRFSWRAGMVGAAQLRVVVDGANQIAETREDNNAAQWNFSVVAADRADLAAVASTLAFTPTPVLQGKPLTASLRVRNHGTDVTAPFVVGLYAGDPRVGSPRIGATTVAGLAGSAETVVAIDVADLDLGGNTTMFVEVDAEHAIDELDEGNNVAIEPLQILALPDPAATLAGIALTPALPVGGEPVTARVALRNLGGQDARDVVVQLFEGDGGAGSVNLGDRTVALVPAGGSADVEWQWTLGQNARAVTVVVDPAGALREANENNNRATLPFDVQSGALFASERYFSPNGDGVRDETALVFRVTAGTTGDIAIASGLGFVVRRYTNVAVNADGRAQVVWDGRDDRGRVVPDGDYRVTVTGADDLPFGRTQVTVDNNLSSVLEAIGTPHEVPTPMNLYEPQIPPAGGANASWVYGLASSLAIMRADTMSAEPTPVISSRWSSRERVFIHGFVFSPDGSELALTLQNRDTLQTRVVRADALGLDAIRPLQPPGDTTSRSVAGYFDANEILLLRGGSAASDVFDVRTREIRPFRDLPGDNDRRVQAVPLGAVVSYDWTGRTAYFAPRDTARPIVDLEPENPSGSGIAYATVLNPARSRALLHKRAPTRETLTLVDFATGTRRVLVDRPNDVFESPLLDGAGSVQELAFEWIARLDEIAVVDGRARRLLRFTGAGDALDTIDLPPVDRVGPYVLDPRDVYVHAFTSVATPRHVPTCLNVAATVGGERRIYDPTTESLFVHLMEIVGVRHYVAEDYPLYIDGASQFVNVGYATRAVNTLASGSPLRLELPADAQRYPPIGADCPDNRPAEWPELILRDGARLLSSGRVQSVSRGIAAEPWSLAKSIKGVWPDENRLLTGDTVVTSLLNGYAAIRAQLVGQSFALYGIAADRNFAYYELDYALESAPGSWHTLALPATHEVLLDEFVTWAPPDPGNYVVRLRVVDRAGNVTTATTTVTAQQHSSIAGFGMTPRMFSPNGDGVLDAVNVNFRVREPASLQLRVTDDNGAIVRTIDYSYGAGDLGDRTIAWDGRDDGGTVVPDGRYRVTLAGSGGNVVVDTVAPVVTTTLDDAYRAIETKDPSTGLTVRGVDPENPMLRVRATDAARLRIAIDAIASAGGAATPLQAETEYLDKDSKYIIPMATYAVSTLRATLTDEAGNRTVRDVAQGPQRLALFESLGISTGAGVRYQPLPFNDAWEQPPSATLGRDGNIRLNALAATGPLRTVGVQVRRADDASSAWTEVSSGPPVYASCSNGRRPCDEPRRQVSGTLTAQGLVPGKLYDVRLSGEGEDGSRLISNATRIGYGGLGELGCPTSRGEVEVPNYIVDPLRQATLYARIKNLPPYVLPTTVDTYETSPGWLRFRFVPPVTGAHYELYVVAVDANGVRYGTATRDCDIPLPPPLEGPFVFVHLDIAPVVQDRCDGMPSGRLFAAVELSREKPSQKAVRVPQFLRWRYVDGITLEEKTTEPVAVDPLTRLAPSGIRNEFDITGWPVGAYRIEAEGGYTADGITIDWRPVQTDKLPVETLPPQVTLAQPADGARVCANALNDMSRASIVTATQMTYRVSIGQGAAPLGWQCLRERGTGDERENQRCIGDYSQLKRLSEPTRLDLPVLGGLPPTDLKVYNGAATLQVKAVNWSGGTMCATSTVRFDSAVEIAEREAPSRLVDRRGEPVIALAPNAPGDYAMARLRLRATEALAIKVKLYADDALLGIVDEFAGGVGNIDVDWNGSIGGEPMPDGDYRIDIEATDDCGQTATLSYPVMLKNTPPALAFEAPAPNETIASAVVDVRGTVEDAWLERWSLDVATAASPDAWQPIEGGDNNMRAQGGIAPQLAAWSRGQQSGPVTLRLRATDVFGNAATTTLPVILGSPAGLIASAAAVPALFSPNADSVLDATRVELALLRAANVAIRAHNASGDVVATLYDGAAAAGARGYAWNGAALPDGDYTIVIDAADSQGALAPEQARLSATIDATAPALALTAPTTGYLRPQQPIAFTVDDAHLVEYRATLSRGGAIVVDSTGRNPGAATLAVPAGAAEGAYVLRIAARDGAGNRSERVFDLTLDATAPVVDLAAPADGAILAAATPTSVRGSAQDTHLASYTLSIAAITGDDWQTLASGTSALDAAEILAWTPARPDGGYRLRLRAEDLAGNTTDAVHAVTIDGTPPVAAITQPADGAFVASSFDVVGTATDAHFAEYRLSLIRASALPDGAWSDVYVGTTPVDAARLAALNLPLAADDYFLRLTVKDQAGLAATAQVRVRIDAEPPPAPLELVGRVENNRNVRLAWNAVAAPDLAGYHVYRGGARITPALVLAAQYADLDAPEGTQRYHVVAIDTAGNASAPSNTVVVALDRTAPVVALARPADGERVRGVADIAGTAWSTDDFHEYRLILEPLAPPGAPHELRRSPLPVQAGVLANWNTLAFAEDTRVRIRLDAEDRSGNVASATVEVTVDNVAPAAPTGVVAALATAPGAPCPTLTGTEHDVRVCWNANVEGDLLGYLVYRDGVLRNAPAQLPNDLRPYALPEPAWLDEAIADGAHTYVIHAIDRAGNVSAPSEPAALPALDFGPPALILVQPQPNTKFDRSIAILATSEHRDIVEVRFAYRSMSNLDWFDIGPALTAEPYRATWTPGALPYGNYEIRAVARDAAGNVDPTPPAAQVVYADLTPPDAPTALTARADGDAVALAWQASTAADVAGYRVERYRNGDWETVAELSAAALTHDDTGRADGAWRYRVFAVDTYGNRSAASAEATANVFGLTLAQPFTPTRDASVALAGRSARTGTLSVRVENAQGSADLPTVALDAQGTIALTQPLATGANRFVLRVTDASGDRSRAAEVHVDRGDAPAAPTGLATQVNGYDVTASWHTNAEPDVVGYRVFRRGQATPADAAPDTAPAASSQHGVSPESAIDGDPQTAWIIDHEFGAAPRDGDPAIELAWSAPRLVVAANLAWLSTQTAAGNVALQGWSGHAWVTLATASGAGMANRTLVPAAPYRTDKVRIVLHGPGAAGPRHYELAEITLVERPLLAATSVTDTLLDGSYEYRVSAVNAYGFESARSEPAVADVGDAVPPDAVVLAGTLAGNAAQLTWSASASPDVARYELRRDGTLVADVAATAPLAWTDAGLANGAHTWVVVAFDAHDNASAPSNAVTLTVAATAPGVPRDVRVTAPIAGRMLDIAWAAGDGNPPVSYSVRRAPSTGGPFVEIARVSATAWRDAPLVDATPMHYTVEAIDAFGNASGQSAPVAGTPRDGLPPAQPILTYPTIAGRPLTTTATTTLVCGYAEPGSGVTVERDGLAIADTTAAATLVETSALVGASNDAFVPAPDGVHLAVLAADDSLRIEDTRGGTAEPVSAAAWLAQWATRGDALYYLDIASGAIRRHEPGGTSSALGIAIGNLAAYAISPDATQILFAGDYATNGATEYGVWIARVDGTQARRIDGVDAAMLGGGVSFSPAGDRALVALIDEVIVIDTATAAVLARHPAIGDIAPAWSPDRRYAYLRVNADDDLEVRIHNLADGAEFTLALAPAPQTIARLAWSPDGSRVGVLGSAGLDLLDARDGRSTLAAPIDATDSDATWTASGRIVVMRSGAAIRTILPPGGFCTDAVSLIATRHTFTALARDAAGNTSLPASPIGVNGPGTALPDLAIGASDIVFVPADARPGDAVIALVSLRNAGAARAAASQLDAELVAPDGTSRVLPQITIAPLDAGATQIVTLDLGALAQAGTWRLRVTADAAAQVVESQESNNRAEALMRVVADGAPQLEVHADRALYAPGDAVTGEVSVAGAISGARVRVAVIDAAGAVVDELGDYAVGTLARGQRWAQALRWNADGVFAGDYRLRARLAGADGAAIAERTSPFAIQAVRHIALSVAPETPAATVGTALRVRSAVVFGDGNAPLDGARLVLVALVPGGGEIALADQPLGALLPGYEIHKDDLWNTSGLAPGAYGLRLRLTAPNYATLAESSVTLDAAAPTLALTGMLALAPAESLAAGQGGDLRYTLANRGDAALAGVVARVRIAVAGGTTPVAQAQQTFDLAPGASGSGMLSLAAPPLALVAHGAILEARLPGDATDTWRVLARLGFGVVDATPPELVVLAPASAVVQPAVVTLRAHAVDRHSTIAVAQFRIDGGAWQPLGLGADGYYVRGVDGLADGAHRVVVRVRDAWGNETTSEEHVFDVDATPPVVTIDGIADGDVVNRIVTPTITIVEAHPGVDDVRLNGAPYVSGTPIDVDGAYLISVRATDAAGNVTLRAVQFVIDRIAPVVSIAQPADGTVVSQSTVAVIVQTEANAVATLTAGAWQAQATADANGAATFAAVPLALGDNTLAATARDRAGNIGGPAGVHVRYEAQSAALVGTVQPAASELAHGVPLALTLTAHNPGATALPAQRLRVRVATATQTLAEDSVTHDFAAGETFQIERAFASDTWPLGLATVTLDVDRAGTWTLLDSETVDVVDRTLPAVTVLAPSAGAVLRAPVTVRASASDALSTVASVEARIDGAAWIALAATATPGEYASDPLALAEGDRTVALRATDGAGNVRTLAPIAFAVDDTAPSIAIGGVADGDLVAHAVTPTIAVTDAHPATSTIALNGAAYVSGTPIAASGAYALHVEATDRAGNTAQADVAFTLDLDAPVVVITSPADGATVSTATVAVSGTTEPLAKVALTIGAFGTTVFADASGVFNVAAANLATGANTIAATATDRAGNIGAPASIVVTYVPEVSLVTGEFGAIAPIVLRGAPLRAPFTVRNPGAAAVDAVPLRVRVFANEAGEPAAVYETTASLASQASQAFDADFDTAAFDGGGYRLTLEALQPVNGGAPAWTQLAQATTHVYAPCAIRTPRDRLFASGFDLVDHIFCDGWDLAASAGLSQRAAPDAVPWLAFARYAFIVAPLAQHHAGALR